MHLSFPLILDGATGTQLQKRGYDGSVCAEAWILEHPEALMDIQSRYADNGSNIVYAPTFGANRIKLEEHKIFGKVEEFNTRLVEISRNAVGGRALVAGDLAPTGKMIYPMGDFTFEQLYDVYLEQASALEKAGVDLYVVETQMNVSEARAAVMAVKAVSDKPVFVTFSADKNGRIISGSDIRAVCVIMEGLGVDAFGCNCSSGPDEMLLNIKRLREVTRLPLVAKPNAGLPDFVDGRSVYNCDPALFSDYVPRFAAEGACVFGGCCGTTEEHISAIKSALPETSEPFYDDSGLIRCTTEKQLCFLEQKPKIPEPIQCSEDLEDDIADCEDDILAVSISCEEDFELFSEAQYAINLPLCIVCDAAALLEKAVRAYQGRCLVRSSADTAEICRKYGCTSV